MLGRISRYLRNHMVLVVVLCLALAATATATAQYITGDGSVRSVRADVPAGSNFNLLQIDDHVAIIANCSGPDGSGNGGFQRLYVRNRSRTRTLSVWFTGYPESEQQWTPGDFRRGYVELTPIGGARNQIGPLKVLSEGKLFRMSVGYADTSNPYTSFEIHANHATPENGMTCPFHLRAFTTNATDVL